MDSDTVRRVSMIIANYLDVAVDEISMSAKLEDLGLDSLGAYELIFQFEEEFKILVPNEQAADFTTVSGICQGIESLQQQEAN